MDLDEFSRAKRFLHLADGTRVAYVDEGSGPPVLLLHGCPFSSFVWRNVIAQLAPAHRCVAPDLLGLGDTETAPGADWSLPAQEAMVLGLLDQLDLPRVSVVGHDHGGAIAQMLAARHPNRIDRLVLSNVEAYDNWPSADERPIVRLTQTPVIGPAFMRALGTRAVFRWALIIGQAVKNRPVLTDELIDGYLRANASDAHRRARTARFLAGQLDPANNTWTARIVDDLRRFDHPTLLLWGAEDPHFGPRWAERLRTDIAGPVDLVYLDGAGHLLMEDRPNDVAAHIRQFLAAPQPATASAS